MIFTALQTEWLGGASFLEWLVRVGFYIVLVLSWSSAGIYIRQTWRALRMQPRATEPDGPAADVSNENEEGGQA